jgi:glycosyltransferase involved in cell wall biosynthesis
VAVRLTFLVDSATYGGAEAYVIQLLEGLPARFACTVLATAGVPSQLAHAARRHGRLVVLKGGDLDGGDLAEALAATQPDIIHVNAIDPQSNLWLLLAAGAHAAPAIATVHMTAAFGPAFSPQPVRRAYERLDRVIAVSQEIRTVLVRDLGVSAGRVEIIRNGVKPLPVSPTRNSHHDSALRIGGLGRLTAQKGFDLLVEATRHLHASEWVEVTVAGEGRDRDALVAAAAGLPLRFIGFRHDVGDYLAALDIFCLPSRADALPLALLEAMMTGLPCVAAAVGEIPAAVGHAVVLVPPEDPLALARALRALARDPQRRADLAGRAAGLARLEFDVTRAVTQTVTVYDQMVT